MTLAAAEVGLLPRRDQAGVLELGAHAGRRRVREGVAAARNAPGEKIIVAKQYQKILVCIGTGHKGRNLKKLKNFISTVMRDNQRK